MPVNGKFTPEQRAVYEIVLEAQLAAIERTRRGNHWNEPHDAAVKVITKGLKKLGLLDGTLPKLVKDGAYREFYRITSYNVCYTKLLRRYGEKLPSGFRWLRRSRPISRISRLSFSATVGQFGHPSRNNFV